MDDLTKVNHLIEHWIEHERQHIAEYEQWAKKIQNHKGGAKTASALLEAAGKLHDSVEILMRLSDQ